MSTMTQFSSALPQKKKVKCNHESINATDLNILITYNKKKNLEFACILNYYFVNIFSFEF